MPISLATAAQKYVYAFQIDEKIVFGLVKVSLLFLLKRLFGSSKRFRIICWILITIIITWALAFLLTTVFQCGARLELNWAPNSIHAKQCINSLNVLIVFSATDILSDLVIIGIPVPLIWSLHLRTRKKLALTGVFLFGFLYVFSIPMPRSPKS